jgi:glycosyltransferase involved in cell wall biosynthesis
VLIAPGVAAQEYVLASGGGLVVEATSAALAHGMRQVLAGNPQRMGQAGRQFVEKNLSWPIAIARIDEMYREAISRSGPITGAGHRKGN